MRRIHMGVFLNISDHVQALLLYRYTVWRSLNHFSAHGAALNSDNGQYEWSPKALRVFEIEHPQPGGDVAAIKSGNVSVTPLDCGFGAGVHTQALQGDALDQKDTAQRVSA